MSRARVEVVFSGAGSVSLPEAGMAAGDGITRRTVMRRTARAFIAGVEEAMRLYVLLLLKQRDDDADDDNDHGTRMTRMLTDKYGFLLGEL